MKHFTHEDDGLKIVMRELTGADVLDNPSLTRSLALAIAVPLGKVDAKGGIDLPDRIWSRIRHVIMVVQQTVSFEGEGSFEIPSVDAASEKILEFYAFLTEQPARDVQFLQAALGKVLTNTPNPSGTRTEKPSVLVPQPDSKLAAD